MVIAGHNFRGHVSVLIYTGWCGGGVWEDFSVSGRPKYRRKAMFSAADCHTLPYNETIILNSIDRASYYMAIFIHQVATEYSLFKSVNCSKYFGLNFTQQQQIITLCLHYVTFMRP